MAGIGVGGLVVRWFPKASPSPPPATLLRTSGSRGPDALSLIKAFHAWYHDSISPEYPMNPKIFAEQMRQARLKSPLLTREQALKQFAEVEAYLARQRLPKAKLNAVFNELKVFL